MLWILPCFVALPSFGFTVAFLLRNFDYFWKFGDYIVRHASPGSSTGQRLQTSPQQSRQMQPWCFRVSLPERTRHFGSLRPSLVLQNLPKRWQFRFGCPLTIVQWQIPTSKPSFHLPRFLYRRFGFPDPSRLRLWLALCHGMKLMRSYWFRQICAVMHYRTTETRSLSWAWRNQGHSARLLNRTSYYA